MESKILASIYIYSFGLGCLLLSTVCFFITIFSSPFIGHLGLLHADFKYGKAFILGAFGYCFFQDPLLPTCHLVRLPESPDPYVLSPNVPPIASETVSNLYHFRVMLICTTVLVVVSCVLAAFLRKPVLGFTAVAANFTASVLAIMAVSLAGSAISNISGTINDIPGGVSHSRAGWAWMPLIFGIVLQHIGTGLLFLFLAKREVLMIKERRRQREAEVAQGENGGRFGGDGTRNEKMTKRSWLKQLMEERKDLRAEHKV